MIAEATQFGPAPAPDTIDRLRTPACAHCSLPVPEGLIDRAQAQQFCCHGCQTAYSIIHGCGLDAYYRLRQATQTSASPARNTARRYAEFDDPAFTALYARPVQGGLLHAELLLENVHCTACVWLLEKLPAVLPGVASARLDFRRSAIAITWDPAAVPLSAIARTLDSLGYAPHPARNGAARDLRRQTDRRMLIRLAVAGACAGNVMLLALALYAGMFDSMEPHYAQLFRWTSMLISLVSLAWPGSLFFRGALSAIRTRTLHLDFPIAVGLAAGAVWGVINTVRGTGEIYFDSLSVLVFALLAGRLIQHRQQRWSADAVELLFSLTPTSARVLRDSQFAEVPIQTVAIGDTVEILAGDSAPVDGVITDGESSIDQALLTGESRPVDVRPGDEIAAGAVNLGGRLLVLVRATGESTRVGRLMRMVEDAGRRRAPIVRLADRFAGHFVAGMLTLAAITALIWSFVDPSRAIDNAAALLIVTCPCALGLSTPLAMTVAIGRAARRGILIKGGDAIQSLARPGTIFLDKTGTITRGTTTLVRWHGDDSLQPLVASLESEFAHPIARALVAAFAGSPAAPAASGVRAHQSGIEGTIAGIHLRIGSPAFVRGLDRSGRLAAVENSIIAADLTPILVAVNGRIAAAAGLGDPVRPDARESIDRLRRMGFRVGILSGDHPDLVAAVGRSLGLDPADVRGGVPPEEKLAVVAAAAKSGPVIMVGDGVNDAAALAAATVGVAVHGGAEASLAAADVYLGRPGLAPIADLILASRRTMGVIRRNFAASIFYNAVAAALAMTGILSPLIAAFLMPISSLTVLTLSFRTRTFGDRPCR